MTRTEIAVRYAKLRWCWDDASMIEEVIEGADDLFDAIDDHANKYNFDDPLDFGSWGTSLEKIQRRQAEIDQLRKEVAA